MAGSRVKTINQLLQASNPGADGHELTELRLSQNE